MKQTPLSRITGRADIRHIALSGPSGRATASPERLRASGRVAPIFGERAMSSGGGDILTPPSVAGPVTISNGGGSVAAGSPVQLIFWGDAWSDPTTTPSAAQLTDDVQSMLLGPWRAGLRQYGLLDPIQLGGSLTVSTWQPPATFQKGDVDALVLTLIEGGTYISGELNLYVVMMPPNTNFGPGGLNGEHWVFPLGPVWLAFVLFGSRAFMTTTFSHELAEMLTDPDGSVWQVNPRNSTTWNEIGDICQNSTGTLSGVTVQAYWSQQDNACLIPQAPSLRKTLSLAHVTLGGQGLRSIQGPIPSLNAFVDRLYGSTL